MPTISSNWSCGPDVIPEYRWNAGVVLRGSTPIPGGLEYYGATKRAHPNRDQIARTLGLDPASVDLFEGSVGGGFGIRGELYPEDFVICAAAGPVRTPGALDRGSA